MRKVATMVALLLAGCSHMDRSIANTLFVASVIAVEIAVSESTAVGPLCSDTDADPPHVCPGTTTAPSAPPPPD